MLALGAPTAKRKEAKMKKDQDHELGIKKVTLRNLDEPTLDAIAGGIKTTTCPLTLRTCDRQQPQE